MGTRADFYVGDGVNAEWLGSVAWDGYEWEGPESPLRLARTEADYRAEVTKLAAARQDWTNPEDGWPWPWEDSRTTDYAYCFVENRVDVYIFGRPRPDDAEYDEDDDEAMNQDPPKRSDWPNMKDRQNIAFGGPRSGLIVVAVG